jgi:thiol-disulfide isomerase/thioredoxin
MGMRNAFIKWLQLPVLLLALAACGPSAEAGKSAAPTAGSDIKQKMAGLGLYVFPEDGHKYDDFTLENLAGEKVSLGSFQGKLIFLNFWATWCGPCRSEMKSMEELYQKLRDEGFVIVAINIQEGREDVKKFARDFGLTFPILLDTTGKVASTYGAANLPTTYLFDKKGFLLAGAVGAREWLTDDIMALFRQILKG